MKTDSLGRLPKNTPLRERITANVIIDQTTGCWVWQKSKTLGYGVLAVTTNGERRTRMVHRLAYEEWVGPIPDGMELAHRPDPPCPRSCCNPQHLRPATHAENMADARLDKCRRGHDYTPENTYWNNGKRSCRTCRRLNAAAQRAKHA